MSSAVKRCGRPMGNQEIDATEETETDAQHPCLSAETWTELLGLQSSLPVSVTRCQLLSKERIHSRCQN